MNIKNIKKLIMRDVSGSIIETGSETYKVTISEDQANNLMINLAGISAEKDVEKVDVNSYKSGAKMIYEISIILDFEESEDEDSDVWEL